MVTSPRFVSSVFAQASAPLLVTPAIAKALQPLNALSCHQANPQDSPPLTLAHSLRADPLANQLPNPQDGPPRSLLHSLLAVPRRNRVVSPQACPLVCPVDSLLQCHRTNCSAHEHPYDAAHDFTLVESDLHATLRSRLREWHCLQFVAEDSLHRHTHLYSCGKEGKGPF